MNGLVPWKPVATLPTALLGFTFGNGLRPKLTPPGGKI